MNPNNVNPMRLGNPELLLSEKISLRTMLQHVLAGQNGVLPSDELLV